MSTTIYPPKDSLYGCVNVDTGKGIQTSYTIGYVNDSTYVKNVHNKPGCDTSTPTPTYVPYNKLVCVPSNNPTDNILTNGTFYELQECIDAVPTDDDPHLPTLTISEYATPSCNDGLPNPLTLKSTTTSIINVCQNTGTESFLIQCNSATAYISYFNGYGCLPTKSNTTYTLFQLGCSSKGSSSYVVSCSSSGSSQQSNDFWAMIIQSTYFAYAVSIGSGLIVGGFFICLCICYCRRRNRNKRHRRSFSSPTQYSTSVQSNGVIVDGIGTPLRSDVLPGLGNNQGSPSQGGQSKQNVRTPLLSQSNEERGGFGNDDDDSEA
jgi:hypothetical protein